MNFPDEPNPIDRLEFWKERILRACVLGQPHLCICHTDPESWNIYQERTGELLRQYLKPGDRVLDVGCGYGALVGYLPTGVQYTGVDFSPDLIQMAKIDRPGLASRFSVCNMLNLYQRFKEEACFDWAIYRGMESMITVNLGEEYWDQAVSVGLRVALRLLLINQEATQHRIIEK